MNTETTSLSPVMKSWLPVVESEHPVNLPRGTERALVTRGLITRLTVEDGKLGRWYLTRAGQEAHDRLAREDSEATEQPDA